MISTQFLQNCQAGDEEAIQTLVRTHQRAVFQLALSILDDTVMPVPSARPVTNNSMFAAGTVTTAVMKEAETATRETFIKALDRLGSYREDTPFATWLYSLAIQVSLRRYRRWKFRRGLGHFFSRLWRAIIRQPEPAQTVEVEAHLLPGDVEMWTSVRRLDQKLRLPVVLRYYHDFSIDEIARLLRMSEGSVHARLDAARERIARDRAVEKAAADPAP